MHCSPRFSGRGFAFLRYIWFGKCFVVVVGLNCYLSMNEGSQFSNHFCILLEHHKTKTSTGEDGHGYKYHGSYIQTQTVERQMKEEILSFSKMYAVALLVM